MTLVGTRGYAPPEITGGAKPGEDGKARAPSAAALPAEDPPLATPPHATRRSSPRLSPRHAWQPLHPLAAPTLRGQAAMDFAAAALVDAFALGKLLRCAPLWLGTSLTPLKTPA